MQHPSRSFWTTRSGQKHRKLYKKACKKVSQKADRETAQRQVHCAYGTQAPACSSKKSATAVAPGKFLVSFSHPGSQQFHPLLNPLLSKTVSTQIWSLIKSNMSTMPRPSLSLSLYAWGGHYTGFTINLPFYSNSCLLHGFIFFSFKHYAKLFFFFFSSPLCNYCNTF